MTDATEHRVWELRWLPYTCEHGLHGWKLVTWTTIGANG